MRRRYIYYIVLHREGGGSQFLEFFGLQVTYYLSEGFKEHLESLGANLGTNQHLGSYEAANVSFSRDISFGCCCCFW